MRHTLPGKNTLALLDSPEECLHSTPVTCRLMGCLNPNVSTSCDVGHELSALWTSMLRVIYADDCASFKLGVAEWESNLTRAVGAALEVPSCRSLIEALI